jgi:hypothetical protein
MRLIFLHFITFCVYFLFALESSSQNAITLPISDRLKSASRTNTLKIGALTWNLAEKSPKEQDCNFLKMFKENDIIVLGIQECEDIRPRRTEGHRSRKWRKLTTSVLGPEYECMAQHKMGGMQLSIYGNSRGRETVDGIQTIEVACGVGNVLTNKGAICMLLRIKDKTIALINAHLAAHHSKVICTAIISITCLLIGLVL